eukprot:gene7941-1155_t
MAGDGNRELANLIGTAIACLVLLQAPLLQLEEAGGGRRTKGLSPLEITTMATQDIAPAFALLPRGLLIPGIWIKEFALVTTACLAGKDKGPAVCDLDRLVDLPTFWNASDMSQLGKHFRDAVGQEGNMIMAAGSAVTVISGLSGIKKPSVMVPVGVSMLAAASYIAERTSPSANMWLMLALSILMALFKFLGDADARKAKLKAATLKAAARNPPAPPKSSPSPGQKKRGKK